MQGPSARQTPDINRSPNKSKASFFICTASENSHLSFFFREIPIVLNKVIIDSCFKRTLGNIWFITCCGFHRAVHCKDTCGKQYKVSNQIYNVELAGLKLCASDKSTGG